MEEKLTVGASANPRGPEISHRDVKTGETVRREGAETWPTTILRVAGLGRFEEQEELVNGGQGATGGGVS